jgi:hypothetical protein
MIGSKEYSCSYIWYGNKIDFINRRKSQHVVFIESHQKKAGVTPLSLAIGQTLPQTGFF